MSLPVILRPQAEADVQTAHGDLEQPQAGLGSRFIACVRETLERIESMPEMYAVVWQDVRAKRLETFRYVVFVDRVEALAVLHGSHDATAWQGRV